MSQMGPTNSDTQILARSLQEGPPTSVTPGPRNAVIATHPPLGGRGAAAETDRDGNERHHPSCLAPGLGSPDFGFGSWFGWFGSVGLGLGGDGLGALALERTVQQLDRKQQRQRWTCGYRDREDAQLGS
ncbi:hypothetical protein GCM10023321_72460 [Pseudonocardia eucalypti]|uniref:Uncharacterized protein n=1 Tax=Pseudonocardia eucalypti TaxID=648755 RepID=A0ABP9R717_9PSEU